ncbi:hypothetical protein AK812_SmicGene2516 [Symbiodinium microadriaticum]|uniref:Uncharacterized protein n=1 Tax=Symbiodinium microadriaticum TaxID=2951 RepID=A0A1Q9F1J1_SYMMI|nr:hypothetical protein AK812_SmicGene2516 [Symbiodinium microadriaticum]
MLSFRRLREFDMITERSGSTAGTGVDFFRNWPVALSSLLLGSSQFFLEGVEAWQPDKYRNGFRSKKSSLFREVLCESEIVVRCGWILFTTANFPDVMVPSYTDTRATFMFFLLYLVVSLYLLNNILLAAAYDAYKAHNFFAVLPMDRKAYSVGKAFRLLASETGAMKHNELQISKERWVQFVLHYYALLGPFAADALFHHVRSERDEFKSVLEGRMPVGFMAFSLNGTGPRSAQSQAVRWHDVQETCLGRRLLELFQDGIRVRIMIVTLTAVAAALIVNATLLELVAAAGILFVSPAMGGKFRDSPLRPWHGWFEAAQMGLEIWVMTAITIFFVLEMSLRMLVLGPARNDGSPADMDIGALKRKRGHLSAQRSPSLEDGSTKGIHGVAQTCVLRQLQSIFTVLSKQDLGHGPGFKPLAMDFYQGGLQNSFFAASHYWALNFNDILSGFVTLFSIMMVNNWFVIVNLIVLNILIALILESSQAVREELQEPIELDLTLEDAQLPGSREVLLQRMLMSDLMKYTSEGFSFQSLSPEGQILVNGETTSAESGHDIVYTDRFWLSGQFGLSVRVCERSLAVGQLCMASSRPPDVEALLGQGSLTPQAGPRLSCWFRRVAVFALLGAAALFAVVAGKRRKLLWFSEAESLVGLDGIPDGCFKRGMFYAGPHKLEGSTRTVEATPQDCQLRCGRTFACVAGMPAQQDLISDQAAKLDSYAQSHVFRPGSPNYDTTVAQLKVAMHTTISAAMGGSASAIGFIGALVYQASMFLQKMKVDDRVDASRAIAAQAIMARVIIAWAGTLSGLALFELKMTGNPRRYALTKTRRNRNSSNTSNNSSNNSNNTKNHNRNHNDNHNHNHSHSHNHNHNHNHNRDDSNSNSNTNTNTNTTNNNKKKKQEKGAQFSWWPDGGCLLTDDSSELKASTFKWSWTAPWALARDVYHFQL